MKTFLFSAAAVCALFAGGCTPAPPDGFLYETDEEIRMLAVNNEPVYPDAGFVVFADLHYFDPALGTQGSAFDAYLAQDRKMLARSAEILDEALDAASETPADFILVCGDLTKDGELLSHQSVAEKLKQLARNGKNVYVVPGNHDVANGMASSYAGDTEKRVDSVVPEEFRQLYYECGFAAAVAEDPDSLSYIAEPVPGLWLFALDGCRYSENRPDEHSVTDGRFNPDTLKWIENNLITAIRRNKAVIGCMHHGILEHYSSNEKYYGDYLLDDYERVSRMFAAYGMRFVFTGHFHAQDISVKQWQGDIPGQFLFDIETGSLVTYPVPWRFINISGGSMQIKSFFVEHIESLGSRFQEFAKEFVLEGTALIAEETLAGYGVPADDRQLLSSQIAHAYIAHLQGDETPPEILFDLTGVGLLGRLVIAVQGDLVRGWYTDPGVPDNELTISTATGTYY